MEIKHVTPAPKKQFTPVTLQVTFESFKELAELAHFLGHGCGIAYDLFGKLDDLAREIDPRYERNTPIKYTRKGHVEVVH